MASTTWRLMEVNTNGGPLTLGSLRLTAAGVSVDTGGVVTSSHAPVAGSLANLSDGDPATTCTFAAEAVRSAGFYIQWVLPAAQDVDTVQLTGSVYALAVVQLVDGTWQESIAASSSAALVSPVVDLRNDVSAVLTTVSQVGNVAMTGATASTVTAADGGLRFSISNDQSFSAVVDASGSATAFQGCSADLEFKIAVDRRARMHAGIYLYDPRSPTSGYRVATIDNTMVLSQFSGATTTGVEMGSLPLPSGPLVLGQKYKVSISVSTTGFVSAALDGVALGTFATPGGALGTVALGLYNYSATIFYSCRLRGRDATYRAPQMGAAVARGLSLPGAEPPAQGVTYATLGRAFKEMDVEFGGNGRVYGTVERKNTPTNVPMRRRVRLHRSVDGLLVRETWSNADGTYEFKNISMRYEYDTIAWDNEMSYRSVVANNLKPEAM